jgi:hypothetical protein
VDNFHGKAFISTSIQSLTPPLHLKRGMNDTSLGQHIIFSGLPSTYLRVEEVNTSFFGNMVLEDKPSLSSNTDYFLTFHTFSEFS